MGLRRKESAVQFQTAADGDVHGKPGPEVLAIAADADRILVTHDRRTMPVHFARFIPFQPGNDSR